MLNDFFINILLLITGTFVGGHILKDITIKKTKTVLFKFLVGVYCGFLGILLIIYSVLIKEVNTLVDLRLFAIMIASYIGGVIPSVVSGIIIILYRFLFYGRNISVLVAVIQVVSLVFFYFILDRLTKNETRRWIYKVIVSLFVVLSSYFYLLIQVKNVYQILTVYSIMVIVAGILEYALLDYVKDTNELYKKYKSDSTRDFLTGLTNTRHFDKKLNMAYERVQLTNEKLTCLMVDIDFFKKVNDTYGHAIGDVVLKELADILVGSVRSTDIVARIGGEEFCTLLFNCNREQSFEIALNINKAVREHQFPIGNNQFINITVSVGIAVYPDITDNIDTLKELADTALYKAKRSGRNRVCDNERCMTNML